MDALGFGDAGGRAPSGGGNGGGGDNFVYEDMVDALRKSFTFFIHM